MENCSMEPIESEQRARSLETVQEFVRIVPALPLPANAAEACGFIRAELARQGEMVGPNDLWIAAHALSSGLTLVTNDEREFRRVRRLRRQNWAT
jgi:tRNA(fMet)-specific endonuclease VapC